MSQKRPEARRAGRRHLAGREGALLAVRQLLPALGEEKVLKCHAYCMSVYIYICIGICKCRYLFVVWLIHSRVYVYTLTHMADVHACQCVYVHTMQVQID